MFRRTIALVPLSILFPLSLHSAQVQYIMMTKPAPASDCTTALAKPPSPYPGLAWMAVGHRPQLGSETCKNRRCP
jgi:hypothetical protein